jgi:hypothetical protein
LFLVEARVTRGLSLGLQCSPIYDSRNLGHEDEWAPNGYSFSAKDASLLHIHISHGMTKYIEAELFHFVVG